MKEKILAAIDDLVSAFIYYDRKEDEELPTGTIEKAIKNNEITTDEMCKRFNDGIKAIL